MTKTVYLATFHLTANEKRKNGSALDHAMVDHGGVHAMDVDGYEIPVHVLECTRVPVWGSSVQYIIIAMDWEYWEWRGVACRCAVPVPVSHTCRYSPCVASAWQQPYSSARVRVPYVTWNMRTHRYLSTHVYR